MRKHLIKMLNQLNQDFYAQISEDFSETRNFPWQGWQKILSKLPKKELNVLDIACGNARFIEFLGKNLQNKFNYVGLDNSSELLKIAANKFKKQKFINFDLIKNYLKNKKIIFPIEEKFDLIVIFGLTHHLASYKLREELLKSASKILSTDGLIVVSNWQFANEQERFAKNTLNWQKIIKNPKINLWHKIKLLYTLLNLEKDDYLLDWRKGNKANQVFRYCHMVDEEEMQQIAKENNLKIIDSFFADGKSNSLNQYFVYSSLKKETKRL